MRPQLLTTTLGTLIKARRATHIEGSPGLGKTQIVKSVADKLNIGFIHVHAPTLQPEDLGLPVPTADRKRLDFICPARLPLVGNDVPEFGVLLIDELPQADNAIQKTVANIVQERELHGQKLKPGWAVITTGNRTSDRAGANRILSHLRNRMTTIEFEPHLEDWVEWAMAHAVRMEVIAFLRFRSNLLSAFDPTHDINPTPRAWVEGVSQLLGLVPPEAEYECIKGAVGEGAAAEFVGFLQICRSLPDMDEVLAKPKTHAVPTDPAVLYAISGSLACKADHANVQAVMDFAVRMPPEFCLIVVRDMQKRWPGCTVTPAVRDWCAGPGHKLLIAQ